MYETHIRVLTKGFSWRIFGTIISIVVSYYVTGKLSIALQIGGIEFLSKIGLYYAHERLWHLVPWGLKNRRKPTK